MTVLELKKLLDDCPPDNKVLFYEFNGDYTIEHDIDTVVSTSGITSLS